MVITPSTKVARKEGLTAAPVEGDMVILNLEGNNVLSFDPVERMIWENLESPVKVEELGRLLAPRCGTSPEGMQARVLSFLERLAGWHLVRIIDAACHEFPDDRLV